MEKIFKKINFYMGIVALASMAMFFLPFLHFGVGGDITMKEYILGTTLVNPHHLAFALLVCPFMILILHLLESLDNKVSHQDLLWSIGMIVSALLVILLTKEEAILIGFYVYVGCAIFLFIFSLIRYFAFKRMG